jgi:hypothetical protein
MGPLTALTIALLRSLYLAILIDRYLGPQTAFNIRLIKGLYFAIIMDRYEGPLLPLKYPCIEASS